MRVRMLVTVNGVTSADDLTRLCGVNCLTFMDKAFRNLPLVPERFSTLISLLWCDWVMLY
jgi:hypothetical protein